MCCIIAAVILLACNSEEGMKVNCYTAGRPAARNFPRWPGILIQPEIIIFSQLEIDKIMRTAACIWAKIWANISEKKVKSPNSKEETGCCYICSRLIREPLKRKKEQIILFEKSLWALARIFFFKEMVGFHGKIRSIFFKGSLLDRRISLKLVTYHLSFLFFYRQFIRLGKLPWQPGRLSWEMYHSLLLTNCLPKPNHIFFRCTRKNTLRCAWLADRSANLWLSDWCSFWACLFCMRTAYVLPRLRI